MFKAYPGKWIVAVSGQNDSMALLSMCIMNEMDIHLCVIHYHKRKEADAEVEYVVEYAKLHHISCDVIHAPEFTQNFQQEARDFRYQAFAELIQKHKAEGVLVGHHYDDHLETILWQFNRNHRVIHYGLVEDTIIYGVRVVRPLLAYTKEELQRYNVKNKVRFFEDESNYDMTFTRNNLRKQILSMSLKEKDVLVKQANEKNKMLVKQREKLNVLVKESLSLQDIRSLEEKDQLELLWMYVSWMEYPHSISKRNLQEIIQQLMLNPIGVIPLKEQFVLSFARGFVTLKTTKSSEFAWTFDTIRNITTDYFTIKLESGTLDGVYVKDEDFPITIRNFRKGDRIKLEFGHQKLTTWFNQRKIPWLERQCWPVVLNKNNKIIYVMGWRCDMYHSTNNPNLFMIK